MYTEPLPNPHDSIPSGPVPRSLLRKGKIVFVWRRRFTDNSNVIVIYLEIFQMRHFQTQQTQT